MNQVQVDRANEIAERRFPALFQFVEEIEAFDSDVQKHFFETVKWKLTRYYTGVPKPVNDKQAKFYELGKKYNAIC